MLHSEPGFLSLERCGQLLEDARAAIRLGRTALVDRVVGPAELWDEPGRTFYHVLDAADLSAQRAWLARVYEQALAKLWSWGMKATASPYPRSWATLAYYPAPGGCHTLHRDSNVYSGVIYLNNISDGGGSTVFPDLGRTLTPTAGSLLAFRGREWRHASLPVLEEPKAVLVLNFYRAGDTWRPAGMDANVYGGRGILEPGGGHGRREL